MITQRGSLHYATHTIHSAPSSLALLVSSGSDRSCQPFAVCTEARGRSGASQIRVLCSAAGGADLRVAVGYRRWTTSHGACGCFRGSSSRPCIVQIRIETRASISCMVGHSMNRDLLPRDFCWDLPTRRVERAVVEGSSLWPGPSSVVSISLSRAMRATEFAAGRRAALLSPARSPASPRLRAYEYSTLPCALAGWQAGRQTSR